MSWISLLLLVLIPMCEGDMECGEGWSRFQRKCYWSENKEVHRDENVKKCGELSSKMVSVHSKGENDFLVNLFNATCNGFWTGGRRQGIGSNDIIWDDMSKHDYTGLTNGNGSTNSEEHLVILSNGSWDFIASGSGESCSVCEVNIEDIAFDELLSKINLFKSELKSISKILEEQSHLISANSSAKFDTFKDHILNKLSNSSHDVQQLSKSAEEVKEEVRQINETLDRELRSISNLSNEINGVKIISQELTIKLENRSALLEDTLKEMHSNFATFKEMTLNHVSNHSRDVEQLSRSVSNISNEITLNSEVIKRNLESIVNISTQIKSIAGDLTNFKGIFDNTTSWFAANQTSMNSKIEELNESLLNYMSNNSINSEQVLMSIANISNEIKLHNESLEAALKSIEILNSKMNTLESYTQQINKNFDNQSTIMDARVTALKTNLDIFEKSIQNQISNNSQAIEENSKSIRNVSNENNNIKKVVEKNMNLLTKFNSELNSEKTTQEDLIRDFKNRSNSVDANITSINSKVDKLKDLTVNSISTHSKEIQEISKLVDHVSNQILLLKEEQKPKFQHIQDLGNEINLVKKSLQTEKVNFCDDGWTIFRENCFKLTNLEVDYEENYNHCRQTSADLVSIHSIEENDFLASILEPNKRYWLGGRRNKQNSTLFEWSDKSVWNFSLWENRENENALEEDCVSWFAGHWSLARCESKFSQLCKKSVSSVDMNMWTISESIKEMKLESKSFHTFMYISGFCIFTLFVTTALLLVLLKEQCHFLPKS